MMKQQLNQTKKRSNRHPDAVKLTADYSNDSLNRAHLFDSNSLMAHTLKLKLRRILFRPNFQPLIPFLPGQELTVVATAGSDPWLSATVFCQSMKLLHPLKLILSSDLRAAMNEDGIQGRASQELE